MGVSGLLPVLRPITERVNVSTLSGRRVGIDGFAWLHRGGYACALELATGTPTRAHITYFLHRINLLRHHGVVPVAVFDGAPLPMKADTNAERRAARAEAKRAGEAALASGDRRAAAEYFQRCVTVTPEMVASVLAELRPLGVEAMVAPYEADAQLAYLAASGVVDAVITEDSDLVVYGVPTLIFKMSKFGDAERIRTADLPDVPDPPMRHSTPDMLLWTAVLSGCDFFPGISGLGIKRAHALVRQFAGNLARLLAFVASEPRLRVPPSFVEDFHRACLVFRHQVVWDPTAARTVHLTPLSAAALRHLPPAMVAAEDRAEESYAFLGVHPPAEISAAVVRGELHPITHQPLVPLATTSMAAVRPPLAWRHRVGGAGLSASGPLPTASADLATPSDSNGASQPCIRTFFTSTASAAALRKPFKRPRSAVPRSEPSASPGEAASSLDAAVLAVAQDVGALPARHGGGSALETPSSAPPSGGRHGQARPSVGIAKFLSSTRVRSVGAKSDGDGGSMDDRLVGVRAGGAVGQRRSNARVVSPYFCSSRVTVPGRPSLPTAATGQRTVAAVPHQPHLAGESSEPPPRPASPHHPHESPCLRPLSPSPTPDVRSRPRRPASRARSLPARPAPPPPLSSLPRRLGWAGKGRHIYTRLSRVIPPSEGDHLDWEAAVSADADASLAEVDADDARVETDGCGSASESDVGQVDIDGESDFDAGADFFPLLPATAEQEALTATAITAAAAADVAVRFGGSTMGVGAASPQLAVGPPAPDDAQAANRRGSSQTPHRPPSSSSDDMQVDTVPDSTPAFAVTPVGRRSPSPRSPSPAGSDAEPSMLAPYLPRRQLAEPPPFHSQLVCGAEGRVSLPMASASPVTPAPALMDRLSKLRCDRTASAGSASSLGRRRRRPPSPVRPVAGASAMEHADAGLPTVHQEPSRGDDKMLVTDRGLALEGGALSIAVGGLPSGPGMGGAVLPGEPAVGGLPCGSVADAEPSCPSADVEVPLSTDVIALPLSSVGHVPSPGAAAVTGPKGDAAAAFRPRRDSSTDVEVSHRPVSSSVPTAVVELQPAFDGGTEPPASSGDAAPPLGDCQMPMRPALQPARMPSPRATNACSAGVADEGQSSRAPNVGGSSPVMIGVGGQDGALHSDVTIQAVSSIGPSAGTGLRPASLVDAELPSGPPADAGRPLDAPTASPPRAATSSPPSPAPLSVTSTPAAVVPSLSSPRATFLPPACVAMDEAEAANTPPSMPLAPRASREADELLPSPMPPLGAAAPASVEMPQRDDDLVAQALLPSDLSAVDVSSQPSLASLPMSVPPDGAGGVSGGPLDADALSAALLRAGGSCAPVAACLPGSAMSP